MSLLRLIRLLVVEADPRNLRELRKLLWTAWLILGTLLASWGLF